MGATIEFVNYPPNLIKCYSPDGIIGIL